MEKESLLLSIIIVTRNPGHDLHLTLNSLIPLNFGNVEIILKDFSDQEDLTNVNEFYGFKNFLFLSSPDRGIYDAMNQALNHVRGKYVYFINAGDQYYDCDLITILKRVNDDYGYLYGGFVNLYPFPRIVNHTKFMNRYTVYLKCINHQSVIFHRKVFEKLGYYDPKLKIESDVLFITEMVSEFKGLKIHTPLSIYKGGGISTTNSSSRSQREYYYNKMADMYHPFELFILKFLEKIVYLMVVIKNFNKVLRLKKKI